MITQKGLSALKIFSQLNVNAIRNNHLIIGAKDLLAENKRKQLNIKTISIPHHHRLSLDSSISGTSTQKMHIN